jgi:hypothetical protein
MKPEVLNPHRFGLAWLAALLGAVVVTLGPGAALAADEIAPSGTAVMVTGHGTVADTSGQVRALIKGGAVYAGEIISSGPATYINLKFSDGGLVLLRPHSRFKIDDFRNVPPAAPAATAAEPAPAAQTPSAGPSLQEIAATAPGPGSRAFFHLLKGGFRAVTGLIGRISHDDYSIATPVATIGIRGTDYIAVLCDHSCASDPVIAKSMPTGVRAEGGLVTGVKTGRIVVGTQGACPANPPGGSQRADCSEIGVGEYHFTSADGQQVALPSEPHFLHVDPMPDPKSCAG